MNYKSLQKEELLHEDNYFAGETSEMAHDDTESRKSVSWGKVTYVELPMAEEVCNGELLRDFLTVCFRTKQSSFCWLQTIIPIHLFISIPEEGHSSNGNLKYKELNVKWSENLQVDLKRRAVHVRQKDFFALDRCTFLRLTTSASVFALFTDDDFHQSTRFL